MNLYYSNKSVGDSNDKGNGNNSKSDVNGDKEGKGGKSDGDGDKECMGNDINYGNGNKDARTKAARGMIMAMKRAMERERWQDGWQRQQRGQGQQQLGWWATKRSIVWATKRAMAMATKRGMVTNGDNMGNGYGKEGGRHSMAAMMGMVRRARPLALQLERGGCWWQWAMVCVCVLVCVLFVQICHHHYYLPTATEDPVPLIACRLQPHKNTETSTLPYKRNFHQFSATFPPPNCCHFHPQPSNLAVSFITWTRSLNRASF